MVLEVCVDSVASAVAAERGGAQRIELCSDLLEGGITPGPGLLALVRERLKIDVYVMARPRGGDFCYDDDEFLVMQREIEQLRRLGADGIVLGVLNEHARVDVERTRRLVEQARPLPVTFHRAIDMTPDPVAAVGDVIRTGAERVLSSGGARSAAKGSATLRALQSAAGGQIAVMAGGGLMPENVRELAHQTGVTEFHASLRRTVPSRVAFHRPGVTMGEVGGNREYLRYVTLEEDVRAMMEALAQLAQENVAGLIV
ncbi:MAG TPA: copper homeostasis protein CutC [Acidobacterium sp.]|uniref:PF03932 family protein CutC n=2 Tax=Acidobacteriaceae TaxID=204434 RepID=C1F5H4_ACIC5|nr:copper homeostasis protein CutC [Acidobacterium capsulatum ATCC 51196]HCT60814.1 copper homeostasis protein CutC [Acidobacterium sp.]